MKNDVEVFLSLGSNLGNRQENLQKAVMFIEKKIGKTLKKSLIYESEAWGNTNQGPFLNQIISIKSQNEAEEILQIIQKIEKELGRIRNVPWGPRTIDIDIIFYNKQIINMKELIIPHSNMASRNFVLIPLVEIAPDFIHPVLSLSNEELLRKCKDKSSVIVFNS